MLRRRTPVRTALAAGLALSVLASACATGSGSQSRSSGPLVVVAAENFWGSLAAQLGGSRVRVTSIITNPNADPHDYEPTADDARTVGSARYVIVNGIGYDSWAQHLVNANPYPGRRVLDVGKLVGVATGGNPHRWYSPPDVDQVIDQITADYKRLDPQHAAYYDQRNASVDRQALRAYHDVIAEIRRDYAHVPVGATESIFTPLAQALGLKLLTPESFLDAVSEGNDPTAADKATVDRQLAERQIKVLVFNSQNATPDVKRLVDAAKANGIPVATITETMTPASSSFQAWQVRELEGLRTALAAAMAGTPR